MRAADVAKEAGVSAATVSYVLNNTPGQTISEPTARRVREAAKKLGYVRNAAAQTLARGKSGFVIVDTSDFATQESASLFAGPILETLRELKYEPFMTWWPRSNGTQERDERLLGLARVTNPDIVITVLPLAQQEKEALEGLGVDSVVSVVATQEVFKPALEIPVKTQVEHLAIKGHTHILFAASSNDELAPAIDIRSRAGKSQAELKGLTWTDLPRHTNAHDLAQTLRDVMETSPDATAICAYNDVDALTALFACHLAGVAVPERMAVIGADNETFGQWSYPTLTTVSYKFHIENPDRDSFNEHIQQSGTMGFMSNPSDVVRPYLIERDST